MRADNCFIPGSDQNKGLLSTFTVKVRCKSEEKKKKKRPFLPTVEAGFQEEPPLRAAHSIRLQQRSNRAGVSLSGSRAVPSCGAGNKLFVVRHNAFPHRIHVGLGGQALHLAPSCVLDEPAEGRAGD